jgi:hypothetical protein
MPIINTPLYCRLFVNCGKHGWSESWPLNTWDFSEGVIWCQRLAQARANILCSGASIEWAVCAQDYPPYAEQAVITAPLLPLPQWGLPGYELTGVQYFFNTANGQYANHLFRAIDQRFIKNLDTVGIPRMLPSGIVPLPADPTTATTTQLFLNCFTTFRDLTARMELFADLGGGIKQWNVIPWELAHQNGITTMKASHPWRRVSWEAWRWTETPGFSPCGEAATVLHTCYVAPCRFYVNGHPHPIHYYWAAPDAVVFPLPHIFWGRARAKQVHNKTGPGEITGWRRESYNKGQQRGGALGDHFTGTPADFLGQSFLPWSPEVPTPPAERPLCDFPGPGPRLPLDWLKLRRQRTQPPRRRRRTSMWHASKFFSP